MKRSLSVKFVAVILCTLMLLAAATSGFALVILGTTGLLNDRTVQDVQDETNAGEKNWLAEQMASIWASGTYGGMPQDLVDARMRKTQAGYNPRTVFFAILNENGEELFTNYSGEDVERTYEFAFSSLSYERFLCYGNSYFEEEAETPQARMDSPALAAGLFPAFAESAPIIHAHTTGFYLEETGQYYEYTASTAQTSGVRVALYLAPNALKESGMWSLLELAAQRREMLVGVLVGSLLLFAAFGVYLCSSAGHGEDSGTVRASGLNAVPLDLYAAAILGSLVLSALIVDMLGSWLVEQTGKVILLFCSALGFGCCLVFVGFCFAFAAQVKMPNHFWWWNSLTGRCLRLALWMLKKCWKLAMWLIPAAWNLGLRLLKDAWKILSALTHLCLGILGSVWNWTAKQLRKVGAVCEHFFSLLPVTWQWLGVGGLMTVVLWISLEVHTAKSMLLGLGFCIAVVLYGSNCFGSLLAGVKRMRSGDLETKVDEKYLVGCFREYAGELNGLADVAMIAAQKQLKSERMKTELITNVSHDIKTPLTSIINYVDLLEKPHTPEQEKMYLEVLSRQSHRMKKLVEDLMEMSKASTGNIPVEISEIDAVEAVNQALGEFSDKLAAAGLTSVFSGEESVLLRADGRLLWRAMSNLLSNAVKYALPGTRLYVDVSSMEDKAVISFKNISGAQLNISADELMERFVRGDSSRNTEGSGLGLNITKSLMELQKGQLQLLVDGDLFKATLIFPKA